MTPQELEIQKKMSRLNVRLAKKRNAQMMKAKVKDTETSPEQVKEARVDKGRSDYGKATIRNWRHSGPSTVEPAMFDPENKRGKTIEKRREEHKARRGVKGAKVTTYKKEEVELDERLGGKGYKPYTSLTGKKVSGDWEDSDRGAGNKAKKRAGGKVEKKSPTYRAYVLNKEEVEIDEGKKKGLWDRIRAKRERIKAGSGEKKAKPGDKDYPKTLNVEGLKQARKNVGADKCWDGYKAKGTKKKGGKEVPNCVKEDGVNEGAAWTKKSGKNPEGGLNEKGRKSYERENPGSDLKAPQPEGGSRKKSFCARMGGMKKKLTSAKTANDPDSRINKALRKWKCNEESGGEKVDGKFMSYATMKAKGIKPKKTALQSVKDKYKGQIYDPKKVKKPSEADKAKAAAERKKRQDADNKAYASRAKKAGFKSTQDYTNVVARYGSEDNYRKGKGLGT